MEDYTRERHEHGGYEFVFTPHIAKAELFETSGHLDWYADGMYPPMELDDGVVLPEADELPVPHPDLPSPRSAATASCRCGCSSSAPSTATSGRAWCTG